jgi:Helicase HerA, central domain
MDIGKGHYYFGSIVDQSTKETTDEKLVYDSADLTTHGVIVGMTGSGKTGLGIGVLEEALLDNIPCLIIDPKGDMGNLLLSFPQFKPSDFRPWIDESEAEQAGITSDQLAEAKAALWKGGLEKAGIAGERLQKLNDSTEITIYTPGSLSGIPLNVLGSLAAPGINWETDAEAARDEIESLVSSILLLADIEADPVSDPRHILLANIVEKSWAAGTDLDLASLIGQIPQPPFRKLGVFEIDTFFPEKERMELAMRLNGLLASPSFSSWLEGAPLDIGKMLTGGDKTKAAIIYLAHLSDTERQFIVTLVLSRMITWFRSQPGSSNLRTLIYMDEVYGYVPPVKEPPSKKAILTIMKQARAFGVGMLLSTQNPVDIDYKALSNAGTWMIGRLQTEQDKSRLLDGLNSASGGVDIKTYSSLIASLDKRQFILHSTSNSQPSVFETRWAQSYLAGPLTKEQVGALMNGVAKPPTEGPLQASQPGNAGAAEPPFDGAAIGADAVPVMPPVSEKVAAYYLDPAAPWAGDVNAQADSNHYGIGAAATVQLLYDDTPSKLSQIETYEAVIFPLEPILNGECVFAVDHDSRDFRPDPPGAATFEIPAVKTDTSAFWTGLEKDLKSYLVANRTISIFKNADLKLYSRVGETEGDFIARCSVVASDSADADMAKLRDKYKTRIDRVKSQISTAENRVAELEGAASAKKQEELFTGVGDLLGGLLGGKKTSTALNKAASRRTATRTAESRADAAAQGVSDKMADLEDLEAELADEIVEIQNKYDDMASSVEPMEVGLEATDVRVAELKAVWIPI